MTFLDNSRDHINWLIDRSQSGAIIQYLIDQYDTEKEISYDTVAEKYQCQQWLAFQISGKK